MMPPPSTPSVEKEWYVSLFETGVSAMSSTSSSKQQETSPTSATNNAFFRLAIMVLATLLLLALVQKAFKFVSRHVCLVRPLPNVPIVPSSFGIDTRRESWLVKIWRVCVSGWRVATFPNPPFYDNHLIVLEASKQLGPVSQFALFGQHVVMVSEPSLVKSVFGNVVGKGLFHQGNSSFNKPNVFSLDTGHEWGERRARFRMAFTAGAVRAREQQINVVIERVSERLEQAAASGTVVQMDKLFGSLTVQVICEIALQYDGLEVRALDGTSESEQVFEDVRTLFSTTWMTLVPGIEIVKYLPSCLLPSIACDYLEMRERMKTLNLRIWENILLLNEQGNLPEGSTSYARKLFEFSLLQGVTKEHVLSEIGLLFVAGHETTAHAMSWFFYSLAANQSVQTKVQEAFSSSSSSFSASSLDSESKEASDDAVGEEVTSTTLMPPYVEAVLKESMRMFPVAANGSLRLVTQEEGFVLSSSEQEKQKNVERHHHYYLPCGTWLLVPTYTLHHSQEAWGEDADEFDPERFLKEPFSSPRAYSGVGPTKDTLTFVPFASGLRNCLGMNLALSELRLCATRLCQRFSFDLTEEHKNQNTNFDELCFTLRPHDSLPLIVKKRR